MRASRRTLRTSRFSLVREMAAASAAAAAAGVGLGCLPAAGVVAGFGGWLAVAPAAAAAAAGSTAVVVVVLLSTFAALAAFTAFTVCATPLLASACLSLSESFLLLSFFRGQSLTMWPILPQDLQPRSFGG